MPKAGFPFTSPHAVDAESDKKQLLQRTVGFQVLRTPKLARIDKKGLPMPQNFTFGPIFVD
jgi:hypothetical protein